MKKFLLFSLGILFFNSFLIAQNTYLVPGHFNTLETALTIGFPLYTGDKILVVSGPQIVNSSLTVPTGVALQVNADVTIFKKITLAQGYISFGINSDIYNYYNNSIDFSGLHVGTKGSSNFLIVNDGDSSLIIQEIYISGEGFRLLNNETTPITIEPRKTHWFNIEFAPTEARDYNATLIFTHNASNLPASHSVPIFGTGLPFRTPIFSIKDTYSFVVYKVPLGKTVQHSFPLYNVGTGSLIISSINIIPVGKSEISAFSLLNGRTPIMIEPDSIYTLIVEFTPTEAITYFAELSFTHNGAGDGLYTPNFIRKPFFFGSDRVVSTDEPAEIPTAYSLSQNYPNPFNPTTKIEYSLPEATMVRLTVYNDLGQEVSILVNEYQGTGKYTVDFNANNLPSGIYFYKIQAGNFNKTQKMVLMK